jgi:hypothetical protein
MVDPPTVEMHLGRMGKLHTLRRAIEREPHKWGGRSVTGASRDRRGEWAPCRRYGYRKYRSFVRHVLEELAEVGNADEGPR